MHQPHSYDNDSTEVQIRAECLIPYWKGWQQPTAAEVRLVIGLAGLSGSETAKTVGVTDPRTVRRWAGGDLPIPFAAWALLCEMAGFGIIWQPYDAGETTVLRAEKL